MNIQKIGQTKIIFGIMKGKTKMEHKRYECNCHETGCQYCDGGLFTCVKCGLIEGSLTTDCPGEMCWIEKGDDVYKGLIDFRDGKWIKGISLHSPENIL